MSRSRSSSFSIETKLPHEERDVPGRRFRAHVGIVSVQFAERGAEYSDLLRLLVEEASRASRTLGHVLSVAEGHHEVVAPVPEVGVYSYAILKGIHGEPTVSPAEADEALRAAHFEGSVGLFLALFAGKPFNLAEPRRPMLLTPGAYVGIPSGDGAIRNADGSHSVPTYAYFPPIDTNEQKRGAEWRFDLHPPDRVRPASVCFVGFREGIHRWGDGPSPMPSFPSPSRS